MNNFLKTMNSMGYELESHEDRKYIFKRFNPVCNSVIIFYMDEKKIAGFVAPTHLLMDWTDACDIYYEFNRMKKDVQHLADLSGYDIIK